MTFKRDDDLDHWEGDPIKKIIILKKSVIDGININIFEIRQYTHHCSLQRTPPPTPARPQRLWIGDE